MYPVSSAVAALFESEQPQVLRITGTDKNNTSISITDANVMAGSFSIDRFSCTGDKIEIGTAAAAELTLKLNNADGDFDSIVFEGAELFVEIGIADWSQPSPTVSYIPCGYFTPDKQPRKLTTISIKALDRMTKFDKVVNASSLSFPATISNLVSQICTICGVTLGTTLTGLPNASYSISAYPDLQEDKTYRTLIQWCAGIMGTCAFIDWDGELCFRWYDTVSYTTTPSNRYNSDLYENDITITGMTYTTTQGTEILSGAGDYTMDMTGNYLAASGIAQILPNVKDAVNGFSYRPFTATVINAPYLWPLDVITFTDKDGNDHDCILTNVNFGLNGTTVLEGRGETAEASSGAIPTSTKEQAYLIEKVAESVRELDSSLDQDEVFNRLTDNGSAQGIYLLNGQLYVNMSYARSGTLILGGLNNQNGKLEVRDASNNVIGEWGKDGIVLNSGKVIFPYGSTGNIYINAPVVSGGPAQPLVLRLTDTNWQRLVSLLTDGFAVTTYQDSSITPDADDIIDVVRVNSDNITLTKGPYGTHVYIHVQKSNGTGVHISEEGIESPELTLGSPLGLLYGGTGANSSNGGRINLKAAADLNLSQMTTWAEIYNAISAHTPVFRGTVWATSDAAKLLTNNKVSSTIKGTVVKWDATSADFMVSAGYGDYIYCWRITNISSTGCTVGTVYRYAGTAI